MKNLSAKNFAVILSTFNGEKYIEDLIRSIRRNGDFVFYIRDDNSNDSTVSIVKNLIIKLKLDIGYFEYSNKNMGFSKSFFKLISIVKEEYIFFADQDDLWNTDKFKFIKNQLQETYSSLFASDCPICIISDAIVIDANSNKLSESLMAYSNNFFFRLHTKNHVLIQNPAPGCTMLINKSLVNLIRIPKSFNVKHDHWCILIAAFFGKIICINERLISYRIHPNNTIGVIKYNFLNFFRYFTKAKKDLQYIKNQSFHFNNLYCSLLDPPSKNILKNFLLLFNKNKFILPFVYFLKYFYKKGFLKNFLTILVLVFYF